MKKLISTISAVVIGTGLLADVINFTAAEGYSNGQLITHSNWNGHSLFLVDNSAGTVTYQYAPDGWRKAVYNKNLGGNEIYCVGVTFTFDYVTPTANNPTMGAEFSTVNTATGGNRFVFQIQRIGSGSYQLSVYDSALGKTTTGTTIAPAAIFGASTNSTELQMRLTVSQNADGSSWDILGICTDLTSGTELGRVSSNGYSTAFFDNDVYGVMNTLANDVTAGVANRVVTQFEVWAIPEPATIGLFVVSSIGLLILRKFRK